MPGSPGDGTACRGSMPRRSERTGLVRRRGGRSLCSSTSRGGRPAVTCPADRKGRAMTVRSFRRSIVLLLPLLGLLRGGASAAPETGPPTPLRDLDLTLRVVRQDSEAYQAA